MAGDPLEGAAGTGGGGAHRFVGLDVSATRGFDWCAIDERRRVCLTAKARDLAALEALVAGLPPDAAVAVDAPPAPAKGLVAGAANRVAEQALLRAGISLYSTPPAERDAPAWMRAGFAVYRMLEARGYPLATGEARPGAGAAVECYPHLSYLALAGRARGRTSKLEWSRAALRGRVAGLPTDADQDQLDAACAALTAWYWARGEWIGYGDPAEGVIVAPRTSHDPALARRSGAEQLSLPVGDAGGGGARIEPPRPATFKERVLGIVARIPPGRVATYGDVARWAGNPAGARAVGTILARHAFEVPGHRVVDVAGRPAAYPEDGPARLRAEHVPFDGSRVDLERARWRGPS